MNICELIDENNSNTQNAEDPPQQQQQQQQQLEEPLKLDHHHHHQQQQLESESNINQCGSGAAADFGTESSTSDNQISASTAAVAEGGGVGNDFVSSFTNNTIGDNNNKSSSVDDDDDNSVYNRMIMFVNSNESSDYGSSSDQENSSSSSSSDTHHDDDDDDFNSSKAYGVMMRNNNNNDENQNQYQLGQQQSSAAQQFSILSSSIDEECQFDLLNPIEKFFKLCENPTPSNIEAASKYVVPALEFASSQEEYARIFNYLRHYCFFSDVLLRSLWLEQIQNVISYLHQEIDNIRVEFTDDFNLTHSIANIINDLMREPAYQVKKCATSSILYIIEKQLLTNAQIEQLIIPSILNLVKENNEDFHIDCVSLFGKLSPLLGQELTSKYFLQPFCRLCNSSVFHTRKACAANIAEIANVVSIDEVEKDLLPHFCEFMKDQMWAIRKVCADSFSQFAMRCRRETREGILTEHFVRLLDDNSRWVKISAYKSLGPFIATFIRSEAEKAELAATRDNATGEDTRQQQQQQQTTSYDNEQEEVKAATVVVGGAEAVKTNENVEHEEEGDDDDDDERKSDDVFAPPTSSEEDVNMVDVVSGESSTAIGSSNDNAMSTQEAETTKTSVIGETTEATTTTTTTGEEDESTSPNKDGDYSDFMFWRNLVPLFDKSFPNSGGGGGGNSGENSTTKSSGDQQQENRMESSSAVNNNNNENKSTLPTLSNLLNSSNLLETPLNKVTIYSSTNNLTTSSQFGQSTTSIEQLSSELKQDIVPPTLLGHFITMVDINTQNSLDSEMNYNCAFNFPAIALTLGVEHWKYIKNLYKRLAEDVSWKVRQTLAYSIHELAIILGTEYTQTDLVPIFDSYVKDVDEVRIGIVANLTKFLSVLSLDYRRSYMPKLNDFLKMDNQRNWRFRNELGLQIAEFCSLLPPECLAEYVQPVAFTLALDKISEVRLTAINALIEIFKQFESKNKLDLRRNFVDDVIRTFANSNRWTFRQLYVVMCENLLKSKDQVDFDAFCHDFLPKLFSFRNEKVPNIRILLARFISTYLVNNEYFVQAKSSQLASELDLTVHYLANDKEMDVRSYFASVYCKQDVADLTNDESKQSATASGDVSMEIVPSSSSSSNFANEKGGLSPELPKIDTASVVLSAAASTVDDSIGPGNPLEYKNKQEIEISEQEQEQQKRNEKENNEDDDDDDEEEWDEVVDKTKIDKLKIVNLDNEMDDEMDIIIESKDAITRLNDASDSTATSSNTEENNVNTDNSSTA